MRTPTEHLQTIQRRIDYLRSRPYQNSFDLAEIGSLEWALVNLPSKREWVGLTNEEIATTADYFKDAYGFTQGVLWAEAKLKEKNTWNQ